jgi:5-(carboxyamino)imidazole ribonucleotide synthase
MHIGILGGGQLARMLVQEAQKLGLNATPLCQGATDPAALVSPEHSLLSLEEFCKDKDLITFESEFIDVNKLKFTKDSCSPNLEAMGLLQDRKTQKELLEKYKIPVVPWLVPTEQEDWLAQNPDWVLKSRRNGYDGYGTHYVSSPADWKKLLLKSSADDFIAERKIQFKRELAVTLFRSKDGSLGHFPLVEWKAKDSKCHWVKGPVKHHGLTAMTQQFYRLMKAIDFVGVLAVEMFDANSKLYINEVAPRVHNSCHYSLNAMPMNQFRVHLMCLLGERLPRKIESESRGFAMVNLIGKSNAEATWQDPAHAFLHWYGKTENRPGRKMGHLNTLGKSPDEALKLALNALKRFQL